MQPLQLSWFIPSQNDADANTIGRPYVGLGHDSLHFCLLLSNTPFMM